MNRYSTMNEHYVSPSSVSESITDYLRNCIRSGKLKPGQKINEREIGEALGVSRSPVREALRIISKEGLATILPRKGTVVAGVSRKEFSEILDARMMIETHAIDLMEEQGVTDFSELRACLVVPEFDEANIIEYSYAVMRFHSALVKTSGNSVLEEFYRNLDNSLKRYQLPVASNLKRMKVNKDEHKDILNALLKRKYHVAKRLLRKHLNEMRTEMLRRIHLPD